MDIRGCVGHSNHFIAGPIDTIIAVHHLHSFNSVEAGLLINIDLCDLK